MRERERKVINCDFYYDGQIDGDENAWTQSVSIWIWAKWKQNDFWVPFSRNNLEMFVLCDCVNLCLLVAYLANENRVYSTLKTISRFHLSRTIRFSNVVARAHTRTFNPYGVRYYFEKCYRKTLSCQEICVLWRSRKTEMWKKIFRLFMWFIW